MSSLHAGYSIAGLAGAGIGGISAWLGISPLPTFTVTAGALIVLGLLAGPRVVLPARRIPGPRRSSPGIRRGSLCRPGGTTLLASPGATPSARTHLADPPETPCS